MKNYYNDYKKIVKNIPDTVYRGPEEQGNEIKKFSLLKNVNIQYGGLEYFSNEVVFEK